MGGSSYDPVKLLKHPGFNIPEPPLTYTGPEHFNKVVEWALECAAMFISPSPKEDGEDEAFKCEDIAQTIRTDLVKLLRVKSSR